MRPRKGGSYKSFVSPVDGKTFSSFPKAAASAGSKVTVVEAAAKKKAKPASAAAARAVAKQTGSKQAASKQASSKPASSKQASSKQASSKQASSKQASSKQASSKPASSKPASSKPASSKQASSKQAASKLKTSKAKQVGGSKKDKDANSGSAPGSGAASTTDCDLSLKRRTPTSYIETLLSLKLVQLEAPPNVSKSTSKPLRDDNGEEEEDSSSARDASAGSASASPCTYTYEYDRHSARGKADLQKALAASPPPSSEWDPNSEAGQRIGSKILVIDEEKTRLDSKQNALKKNRKPYQDAVWDEGRIIDYDNKTGSYVVKFANADYRGSSIIENVNPKVDAALVANNLVWARFQKQPFWPALTFVPNEAAIKRSLVPPNQASGARLRLFYFQTNERGEIAKNPKVLTQFEYKIAHKRDDYYGDGSRLEGHPKVPNPVNPHHLLAPDPNKVDRIRGSSKYLKAVPMACREIQERQKVRDVAIKALGDVNYK